MSIMLSLLAELNHAADSLGLYRAELARILGLKCGEVPDAKTFQSLLRNDDVAMMHWFRRQHAVLGMTPLLAIVDDGRLDDVIAQLH